MRDLDIAENETRSSWPSFTTSEIGVVSEILLSGKVNYWTGHQCKEFESRFLSYLGVDHSIALMNGTIALELGLKGIGIGTGDEVIVTPRSFFASASCVLSVGATPVFADVDRDLQSLTAKSVLPLITKKTKAIIVVHLGGVPADMGPLVSLADEYGISIIEDCAQAHGARYKKSPVGTLGRLGTWSFCQDKIMTTGGEGGMVATNDSELWESIWSMKDHGKDYAKTHEKHESNSFRWLHDSWGTNARMLEIQAAIGLLQLDKLDEWTKKRRANCNAIRDVAERYDALRVPAIPDYMEQAGYKCYLFVNPDQLASSWSRDRILAEINALGVPAFSGSCPEIYREKAFQDLGCVPPQRLPVARELGETSLMFLVHPTLTECELDQTCNAISTVIERASR